jgi:hypothetical protein
MEFFKYLNIKTVVYNSQHNYWYIYTILDMYYMFQPKRPSSGTRALTIPLFFPPAMPPCTGQCLHVGSVLDRCIVLVMPLYYINITFAFAKPHKEHWWAACSLSVVHHSHTVPCVMYVQYSKGKECL